MNLPMLKQPGYTLEDWKTWEGAWELIDGVAYPTYGMAPAPTPKHQSLSIRLSSLVWLALEEARRRTGGHCQAFHAPIDVFLGDTVVQPDLVVVCDPDKVTGRGVEGAPDLVAEILSPGTAGRDLTRKRWLYEAAGVKEYLILDPEEEIGMLLVLKDGKYVEAARVAWGTVVRLLDGGLSVMLD